MLRHGSIAAVNHLFSGALALTDASYKKVPNRNTTSIVKHCVAMSRHVEGKEERRVP